MKTHLSKWLCRVVAVVMAAGAAQGASLYWDGNGDGTRGGDGTWNTSGSSWWTAASGGTLQAWANGVNGNSAYLGGTAGTLTLGADVTVDLLDVATVGYVINGDAGGLYKLTLDSSNAPGGSQGANYTVMSVNGGKLLTINAPVVLTGSRMHQFRSDVTINGVVSGTQGFTAPGSSGVTLTLNGSNTFSGGVSLGYVGTVVIGHDQALGIGSITPGGGPLRAGGGNRTISTVMSSSGGGNFYLQTDGTNNLTLAGGVGTGIVGGKDPSFTVNNPVLMIDRPLYAYYGQPSTFVFTKAGTGTMVLAQSSSLSPGTVNVNAGTVIVNGGSVAASTLNGTVTSNSAVITGLSSTAGLRIGQQVSATGLTFANLEDARVIVSIDSATQVTLGAPVTSSSGSYSITFSAVGALGYNTGNITVSNAATLGGSGTIVLATGKTNTVLAGGTIAPGSITAGAEVGTLTFTNGTFSFQENARYAWQYKDGAGDKVRVYGTLILPTVATVAVSQVSGSMPADPPIFTATTLAGASSLTNWVVTGVQNYTVQISGTTNVILKAPPMGTIIMFK